MEAQPVNIPESKLTTAHEVNNLMHNLNPRSISSQTYPVNNIEDTVKEVEEILRLNPALPRLTRGEILDLLDNITKTDLEKVNHDVRDPKAIMVVMPFTPSNDGNNMEEFFTKAPVTHIIGAEPFSKTESTTVQRPSFRRKRPIKTSTTNIVTTEKNEVTNTEPVIYATKLSENDISLNNNQAQYEKKTNVRRRRPLTTRTTTPASTTTRSSSYTFRTRSPVRRRTTTTTERYENHKYPEEEFDFKKETYSSTNGMRIINPPQLSYSDSSDLPDLYLEEGNIQEVYKRPETSIPSGFKVNKKPMFQKSTTAPSFADEINIPDNLKPVFAGMNLEAALNDNPTKKTVQKIPNVNDAVKINELLASMGVFYPTTTSPTTSSTLVPDVKNVVETLNPEMKELLMSFGLIPNPNEKPKKSTKTNSYPYVPAKPQTNHEAYVGFKPLPDDLSTRSEMDELLATFGLLRTARNQKSLKKKVDTDDKELNFDMVPDSLKHVLDDIGLRNPKTENTSTIDEDNLEKHVFNPMDSQYASEEEMEKLSKLLSLVKSLEKLNRTVTEDDIKKVDIDNIKDLVNSFTSSQNQLVPLNEQKNSPNPLNDDNGLSKNEVKRQESSTVKIETTTAAEESNTPSIKDLEDSFGGQSEPVSETAATEATTEAKKTGFYYLVDWNTFLDIDNQKGKRVNLRFQPTIGDPKNFLSVSVP